MKRVIIALFALMVVASCKNNSVATNGDSCCGSSVKSDTTCSKDSDSCATCCSAKSAVVTTDTVEVLYMHGKQRCVTCIAIGSEASELIKELNNDMVVMKTIDFSTPEGEEIADKYEIATSSLIVVRGDRVENVTPMSFQYAKSDPGMFKKNLKESILKMLE